MEKQITPELNFYKVDKQFLSYLHNEDKKANGFSCVPTMDYSAEQKEKFMCGIIVSVNGIKYLAPVSSYAIKKSNNVLLYSDGGRVTSSIRLNFMFPVAKGTYKRYEFEKETDLKYLSVVKQEWLSANQQRDNIRKLAKSTYLEVRRFTAKGKAPKWACNFSYLEQLCNEWEKSHGKNDKEDSEKNDNEEKEQPIKPRPLTEQEQVEQTLKDCANKINEECIETIAQQNRQARQVQTSEPKPQQNTANGNRKKSSAGKGRGK